MNAFWRPETGHALACQTWTLRLRAERGEDRRVRRVWRQVPEGPGRAASAYGSVFWGQKRVATDARLSWLPQSSPSSVGTRSKTPPGPWEALSPVCPVPVPVHTRLWFRSGS